MSLQDRRTGKKLFLLSAITLSLAGLSTTINAQTNQSADRVFLDKDQTSSFGVGYGELKGQRQLSLMYTSPVMWSHNFNNSRLTLRMEGQLAQWELKDNSADNRHITQISAVPLFAWELTERFSLKGGIGVAYFTSRDFGEKRLGTKFNFADVLGAGYKITPNSEIAYYYTHYSNAGIKNPNPGLEMHKIVYNHSF